MLRWSAIFLVIAIVAAVFGFGGIAVAAAGIARILFFVFLVLFLVSLIGGFSSRHRIIKRMDTTLDLFAGANYTKESYSTGIRRNLAALTIGDLFRHQIGKNTSINETLVVYPELSHLGEYRLALDISLATKINAWLGWQSTLSDRYISDPIPATVNNDFIFSTGFNFTFSH
jgi:uncharacterized membrane protein YtjA (UPF0391 family)